jgi:UDP-N-acetylmuramoylalanine--D-glutamate ligase
MVATFSVRGRRVTVVGAARSGIAAAELLKARGGDVTLSESKAAFADAERLRGAGIRLELGGHDPETFVAADLVVLSPGVPLDMPAVQQARAAGIPVIGEIELASRWLKGRIVAITGTKGKSTTTTLTARMLAESGLPASAGGNIGIPLSSQVEHSTPETLHVIEVSSFQLETTDTFHPWIAALLNFSADHLDRHPDLESYGAAKARIFSRQTSDDWSVVNADDPTAIALAAGARSRRRWFGFGDVAEGVTLAGNEVVERSGSQTTPLVPLNVLRVAGRHTLADVLAAAAVSRVAGASVQGVARAVETFTGIEHAMETVATIDGVRFINDSKATTIGAARAAAESVDSDLAIVLGGRLKAGDFAELRDTLRGRARAIVAMGESAPLIVERLSDVAATTVVGSVREAVRAGFEAVRPRGTVLLAPACASFDMFADFAERGRRFKEEVARLAEERRAVGEQ